MWSTPKQGMPGVFPSYASETAPTRRLLSYTQIEYEFSLDLVQKASISPYQVPTIHGFMASLSI